MGDGVEWGIHCCTILALLPREASMPAARLAEFHGVAPAYLAKHLQALARAGIVTSVAGSKGGYRLARPAHQISVLDVVEAIEDRTGAFDCTEIRQRGPAAMARSHYVAPCPIAAAFYGAEAAWRQALAAETIASILGAVGQQASPTSAAKAAAWFQEVVR